MLFQPLQGDPIQLARLSAVIGGEALQRSFLGRAEGEVGGVLHWGGLSGLTALHAAGWRSGQTTAPTWGKCDHPLPEKRRSISIMGDKRSIHW
jgi:hypothetical protein